MEKLVIKIEKENKGKSGTCGHRTQAEKMHENQRESYKIKRERGQRKQIEKGENIKSECIIRKWSEKEGDRMKSEKQRERSMSKNRERI